MTRPFVRLALAGAVAGCALILAGCVADYEGEGIPARALVPLKPETLAQLEDKGMTKSSPMVVRIFKQESELEVWKPNADGRYELFKTYPICRWSGELGPKIKEGDRQAPEGFYTITPGLMNPRSNYYLAFNMGFPNAFDRAHNRTGAHLMVHGDCSSRGCYAMTDEQMAEIYALGRESFAGGQRSFQVQAYPFRMTPANLAKHRNNPHIAFWRMLKEGNDHFLLTRQEVAYNVCERRYVFNAVPNDPTARFDAAARCPAFEVPAEIAQAVEEKRREDDIKVAALVSGGKETAPVRTGTDGGMHPVFLAALQPPEQDVNGRTVVASTRAPGTIPAHAVPPRQPAQPAEAAPARPPATQVASAPAQRAQPAAASSGGNWFTRLFSSDSTPTASTAPSGPARPAAQPTPLPAARPAPAAAPAAPPRPAQGGYGLASAPRNGSAATAQAGPALRPSQPGAGQTAAKDDTQAQTTAPAAAPAASNAGLLGGSAPVLGAGSFSR